MTLTQRLIFEALAGYAGLSSLVGARIYPDVAPQETSSPYVVWQEVSFSPTSDLNGTGVSDSLDNPRIQVTAWAKDPRGGTLARDVHAQIAAAMANASGFKSVCTDSRALPYERDTKLHGMQSDFSLWIKT